ncbi:unnamed protein product [Cuscuta campestris]|uniref:Endonuclease/exonuclease/phosphatase domain-containing protein n=1 Tax=Cuscuta campestris TaxID=132261 RepID=A0A484LXV4_9ASTE|nr:unnamed protein product [Cuscuta campestris]
MSGFSGETHQRRDGAKLEERLATDEIDKLSCRTTSSRGVRSSLPRLQALVQTHRAHFLAILEPFVKEDKIQLYAKKLGFSSHMVVLNNKAWIFWDISTLQWVSTKSDAQLVSLEFQDLISSNHLLISTIYGKHSDVERRGLWEAMLEHMPADMAWFAGGDFNIVASLDEHKGSSHPSAKGMAEFNDCILACGLNNINPSGGIFTSSGRRPTGMEHWESSRNVNGMIGFAEKLKTLKGVIRTWSKEVYGDIFQNVKNAELLASEAQAKYEYNPSEDHRAQANLAAAKLIQACKLETSFWQQKSRVTWLKEGDSNTKFYHAFVKGKRSKLKITNIKDDMGLSHVDEDKIGESAVHHFTSLFSENKTSDPTNILSLIPTNITEEDNLFMRKLPDLEEIKGAVWSLNEDAAGGPDGFNGRFFRGCWDFIQHDLLQACQEFFIGVKVPPTYGSTIITLIPKVDNPIKWKDYRPISLSVHLHEQDYYTYPGHQTEHTAA